MKATAAEHNLVVLERFENLLPPLTPEEDEELARSMKQTEGPVAPMVVWQGRRVLIDGHNRLRVCKRYGYEFDVVELRFTGDEDAENWIIRNNLARRNLPPDVCSYFRGKLYESMKRGNGQRGELRQSDVAYVKENSTSAKLSKELGVSSRTLERDGAFSKAVDKLGVEKALLAGEESRSRKEIVAAAKGETPAKTPAAPAKPTVPKGGGAVVRKIGRLFKDLSWEDKQSAMGLIEELYLMAKKEEGAT